MAKSCNKDGCNYPRFGGGFCKGHGYLRTDKKLKPLNRESKKTKARRQVYKPLGKEYLQNNPVCEIHDCVSRSTNTHHKMGREGFADDLARENDIPLVSDVRFFLACCSSCHPQRIHENPKWAREHGYLI